MFDAFKVHAWAWGGKLKKHPDLGKTYWMYFCAHAFALIAACYTAFMSYKFWFYSLGEIPYATELAWLITSSIAGVAFVFIGYIGYYLNARYRKHYVSDNETQTFKIALVIVLCVVGFDIFANLKGVEEHAHASTEGVIDNNTATIDNSYQSRIGGIEKQRDSDIRKHEAAISALKNTSKHSCNKRGCEKGYSKGKRGNPHWKGAITPFGYAAIAKHEKEIESIRAAAKSRIDNMEEKQGIVLSEHKADRDISRSTYNRHVGLKLTGHKSFVKLLYLIVLFISLTTSEYIRESKIFTNNMDVYKTKDLHRKMVEKRMALEQRRAEAQIDKQYKDVPEEEAPTDSKAPKEAKKKGILKPILGDPKELEKKIDKLEQENQDKEIEFDIPETEGSEKAIGHVTDWGDKEKKWKKEGAMRVIPTPVLNESFKSEVASTPVKQGYTITCKNCGKVSQKPTPRAKYCDAKCRKEFYNKTNPKKITA